MESRQVSEATLLLPEPKILVTPIATNVDPWFDILYTDWEAFNKKRSANAKLFPEDGKPLVAAILKFAPRYDVPIALAYAVAFHESKGDFLATNKGALGAFQVRPYWHRKRHRALGIIRSDRDYMDPWDGSEAGIEVLSHYIAKNNGNVREALYNYRGKRLKSYVNSILAHQERLENVSR